MCICSLCKRLPGHLQPVVFFVFLPRDSMGGFMILVILSFAVSFGRDRGRGAACVFAVFAKDYPGICNQWYFLPRDSMEGGDS